MSRSESRKGYPDGIRIELLEGDADVTDERFEKTDSKLESIRKLMVGVLVSALTATIMLALNLAVGG